MSIRVLSLFIVALSACDSLAEQLGDQTTTINPVRSPIFREHAELENTPEQQHASGATKTYGSIPASERLMKELKEINKSDNCKSGVYSVALVDDNLYEWLVKLSIPDPQSVLHSELKKLESEGHEAHVALRITFSDNYPAEPPFVRIAYPPLVGPSIQYGGAICMQMLTKKSWNGDWSLESFILTIAGHLIENKPRVSDNFNRDLALNTYERAKRSFDDVMEMHQKNGW